jgi:serine/threonine-protein kinase
MASVFEARDTKLNRQVAVKVMFPHLARKQEAVARFKREARAAAGLDHDHILRVFDVGGGEVEDGNLVPPYIVLELIDGQSLSEFFKERKAPLAEVVAAIGVALCRGLAQAHEQNIVHRDIKPANVMVTRQGRLALADFGVAHIGEDDSVVTRTGAILGTPAYMSPEQATSDPVDSRSDLYSLGATLYSIATGVLPYSGSAAKILTSILEGSRVPVEQRNPAIGRELSRIIDKMMETHPEDRIAAASEAERALLEVVQGGGFEDPDELLIDYFTHPDEDKERRARAIAATLVRAKKMADEGRVPMALSLSERVLSLDKDNLQAQTFAEKFGRQRNQRLWPAIVLPMVVTAAAALIFWGSQPGSIAEYVDTPTDTADPVAPVAVTVFDAGSKSVALDATVLVIAKPDAAPTRGRRPRTTSKKPRAIDAGPAPTPDARAVAALPPPVPEEPASLVVDIKPWCDVWIDGKKVGRASPTRSFTVAAGTHKVECKQPSTGLKWQEQVTLEAGQKSRLRGTVIGKVSVRVRLGKGEGVRISGKTVKSGQSTSIQGGRHLVEILSGGKVTGKPRYLDLRQDCVLKDEPKLACFAR